MNLQFLFDDLANNLLTNNLLNYSLRFQLQSFPCCYLEFLNLETIKNFLTNQSLTIKFMDEIIFFGMLFDIVIEGNKIVAFYKPNFDNLQQYNNFFDKEELLKWKFRTSNLVRSIFNGKTIKIEDCNYNIEGTRVTNLTKHIFFSQVREKIQFNTEIFVHNKILGESQIKIEANFAIIATGFEEASRMIKKTISSFFKSNIKVINWTVKEEGPAEQQGQYNYKINLNYLNEVDMHINESSSYKIDYSTQLNESIFMENHYNDVEYARFDLFAQESLHSCTNIEEVRRFIINHILYRKFKYVATLFIFLENIFVNCGDKIQFTFQEKTYVGVVSTVQVRLSREVLIKSSIIITCDCYDLEADSLSVNKIQEKVVNLQIPIKLFLDTKDLQEQWTRGFKAKFEDNKLNLKFSRISSLKNSFNFPIQIIKI